VPSHDGDHDEARVHYCETTVAAAAAPSASAVPVSATRREMRRQSFLPVFVIDSHQAQRSCQSCFSVRDHKLDKLAPVSSSAPCQDVIVPADRSGRTLALQQDPTRPGA
jgi:hypothetical protein